MRTNEWYFSIIIISITYFSFAFLSAFRLPILLVFSFIFSVMIARDETRLGRVVLQTIVPILISIVLLFSLSIIYSSLSGELVLQSSQMSHVALGFLSMLLFGLILGAPLAWLGARSRLADYLIQRD